MDEFIQGECPPLGCSFPIAERIVKGEVADRDWAFVSENLGEGYRWSEDS